jgi:hypothetical protein
MTALVKINSKNIKYSVKDYLKIFINNFQDLFIKFKNRKKVFFYNVKEKNNFFKQKNYTKDIIEHTDKIINNSENTKCKFLVNQDTKIYIFINLENNNNLLNTNDKTFRINQTITLKILNMFLILFNSFGLISTLILPFFFKNFVDNNVKSKSF